MFRDCTFHILGESKMVFGQAKDEQGQVIMAGLYQRPDATNAKNLVGYLRDQTADLVRQTCVSIHSTTVDRFFRLYIIKNNLNNSNSLNM